MFKQLNRQVGKALIGIVLRVIDPGMLAAKRSFFFLGLAVTDHLTLKRMVMSQQLIGDDRKTPNVRQAGQKRIATDDLGRTIVRCMHGQTTVRLRADVVAINQPGFCMVRII